MTDIPTRAITGVNPYDDPDLYAGMIVGDMLSPGDVVFTGHDLVYAWEKEKTPDGTGEHLVLKGRAPQEFTATFSLFVDSDDGDGVNDFVRWDWFTDLLRTSVEGPDPQALPVYYPDLVANQITSIVLVSIGGRQWLSSGAAVHTVKLRTYDPEQEKEASAAKASPKVATATPANTPGAPPPKPDPNAAAKEELNTLLDEAGAP
jgi:hypothetical protein